MDILPFITAAGWSNKNWTFQVNHNTGIAYLDNYQEVRFPDAGARHYVSNGTSSTTTLRNYRGLPVYQTDSLTGVGNFVSAWGYNSADLLTSSRFPGGTNDESGEVVHYTY